MSQSGMPGAGSRPAVTDHFPQPLLDRIEAARALGLAAFKLGTEEEGLATEEVRWLAAGIPAGIGCIVKIGGPCARADLRLAGEVGATAVVAPMVESPFAMRRFLEAADEDLGSGGAQVARAFNLETAQALAQLDAILDVAGPGRLGFVNIGRSDLGASLGYQVGDAALHEIVAKAILHLQARGLPVHVGGKVTRATLKPLLAKAPFPMFHTRFLAFDIGPRVGEAIDAALHIELGLLDALAGQSARYAPDHRARADEIRRRLQG